MCYFNKSSKIYMDNSKLLQNKNINFIKKKLENKLNLILLNKINKYYSINCVFEPK